MTKNREIEIDRKLERLINETKSDYITQGVSFNKNCVRQMYWLKLALTDSVSFSGLVKEMLALRYEDNVNRLKKLNDLIEDESNNSDETMKDIFLNKKDIEKNWLL